jgi:membrane protease subunit HflK
VARGDDEEASTDERIRRQVGRTVANWLAVLLSLAVIGAWAWTGIYQLEPGESAVILRLGRYDRTVDTPGLKWHLPPPLEYAETVNVAELRREKFGYGNVREAEPGPETATFESAMQTADSNIVNLSYVVQYRIRNPFTFVYGMAYPAETLRDAAQAAVRQVVGQRTVEAVLSADRAGTQREARTVLQSTLDSYFEGEERGSPFEIQVVDLQVVQPPTPVQDAFRDVVAAQQDNARAVSESRGDAKEIRERAGAEAAEIRQQALAYKEARILEARGEARRFEALLAEYQRAPDVTRQRLYLETMESVLKDVEKVIVEPSTVSLVPFLPLQQRAPAGLAPSAPAEVDQGEREEPQP